MKNYIPKKRYPSWGALIYTVVGPPAKYMPTIVYFGFTYLNNQLK